MFDIYDQPHVLWACAVELHKNRLEISEKSKEISTRLAGRRELISSEIRAMKVKYVARALTRVKAEIKKLRGEEGYDDSNLPTWRLY